MSFTMNGVSGTFDSDHTCLDVAQIFSICYDSEYASCRITHNILSFVVKKLHEILPQDTAFNFTKPSDEHYRFFSAPACDLNNLTISHSSVGELLPNASSFERVRFSNQTNQTLINSVMSIVNNNCPTSDQIDDCQAETNWLLLVIVVAICVIGLGGFLYATVLDKKYPRDHPPLSGGGNESDAEPLAPAEKNPRPYAYGAA